MSSALNKQFVCESRGKARFQVHGRVANQKEKDFGQLGRKNQKGNSLYAVLEDGSANRCTAEHFE